MINSIYWAEHTWPDLQRKVTAGCPVFLPLGATEQHGHHMAVNVDVVLPSSICAQVAGRVGGLVLPAIPYGNRSQPRTGGGPAFGGTINLTAGTFSLVVRDVLIELFRQRVRRIVVVNGHYENIGPSIEGIELALDAIGRSHADGLNILRIDHWDLVQAETINRVFPEGYPGIELEHASVIETSMMLATRPDLVDLTRSLHDGPARFKPYDRYPLPMPEVPPSGVLSMTEGASAEKGNWLLADCIARMTEIVRQEFRLD